MSVEKKMEVTKICVMGAGMMGHGIAQVCATSGYHVSLCDINELIPDFRQLFRNK